MSHRYKVTDYKKVLKELTGQNIRCEWCNNCGLLLTNNTPKGKLEIEKCYNCKKFKSNLEAWKSVKPSKVL